MSFEINIDDTWYNELLYIFNKEYFKRLILRINDEYNKKIIFPPKELVFNAFNLCKYEELSAVIIGQDPYINKGEANGLAFSCKNIKLPPSLRNIYKEIENNFGTKFSNYSGDLSYLAKQGVLLLNSILTVQEGVSCSHKDIGWENFTDDVITHLNTYKKNIVYFLWGNYAKNKGKILDSDNNLILKSSHPSPFSASGFFNNNHFYKANEYLKLKGKSVIKWIE